MAHDLRIVHAMDIIVDVDHFLVEVEDYVAVVHPVCAQEVAV